MTNNLPYAEKNVYLYELGAHTRAVALALQAVGAQVSVWNTDSNFRPEELEGVANIKYCAPDTMAWTDIDAFVHNPARHGANDSVLLHVQNAHVPILTELDLLYQRSPQATHIGVFGGYNKALTAALIYHVLTSEQLPVAIAGDLGVPFLSAPELGKDGIYILDINHAFVEASHLWKAQGGVILNSSAADDAQPVPFDAIVKCALRSKTHNGWVVNVGDVRDDALLQKLPHVTTYSAGPTAAEFKITAQGKFIHNGRELVDLTYFDHMPGIHNWQCMVGAFLVCRQWMDMDTFFMHVRGFMGLPHRLEKVHHIGKIKFINDSKSSQLGAALRAVQSYPNVYWIVGGKATKQPFNLPASVVKNVRGAFVIGEAESAIAESLSRQVPTFACGNLETAVYQAYQAALRENRRQSYVVLAPGAASFDQFDNFEHRGDYFANVCRSLSPQLEKINSKAEEAQNG